MSRHTPPLTFMAWLRYDLIREALEGASGRLLEIGCGQGAMGVRLARRFRYLGVEPDARSASVASDRLGHVPDARFEERMLAEPGDETFDVICAFEVLEHIEDDAEALHLWRSYLRAGGRLVLSVPAWQHRFGPADVHVGHFRRYDRDVLKGRLEAAGYELGWIRTYGFPLGYALELVRNFLAARRPDEQTMDERSGGSGRFLQPRSWLAWVPWLVTLPFRMLQRPFARTRFGTGFVVLAHKRE